MSAMASQLTGILAVYSTVSSGAHHRRSTSLACVGGFPSQKANNADNASIWWRRHEIYTRSKVWGEIIYVSQTSTAMEMAK